MFGRDRFEVQAGRALAAEYAPCRYGAAGKRVVHAPGVQERRKFAMAGRPVRSGKRWSSMTAGRARRTGNADRRR